MLCLIFLRRFLLGSLDLPCQPVSCALVLLFNQTSAAPLAFFDPARSLSLSLFPIVLFPLPSPPISVLGGGGRRRRGRLASACMT